MTVDTFYSSTADGRLESSSTTYLTARTGNSLAANTSTTLNVCGQTVSAGTYYCNVLFFDFDTSTIPDDAVISSVVFKLYCSSVGGNLVAHVQEVYERDWGTSLTTADWVAGESISGLTRVATLDTTGLTTGSYKSFVSDAAMLSAINKTGVTRFLMCTSRFRNGDTPTGAERVQFEMNESLVPAQPTLEVTYTSGVDISCLLARGFGIA